MWGFFSIASMVAAIAVCFTPQADRRFSQALSAPPPAIEAPMVVARAEPPVVQPAPMPAKPEPDAELLARLKLLEEQLDNVTGSIAKLPPPPPPPPSGVTPQSVEGPKPAPAEAPKVAEAPKPAEAPKQVKTAAVAPVEPEPQEMVVQIPATVAPPAPEPVATASVPATSFGLDLGSEASFGALRARWDTLKKAHPELARLSPRISVRDAKGRVELRLIAGPFSNASDAARVCAQLFVKGVSCDGGLFDGQRLPQS
jgi:hypothetical protein